jgi:RNA polymerase sigma-70 factor, ECF subfamily
LGQFNDLSFERGWFFLERAPKNTGTFVSSQDSYIQTAGDAGSDEFERLVKLYYEPLYRFAMSLTRAESEACDLVQDTFVTWAEKGGQLADHAKVKPWLFTTLHRRFLQIQRRSVRFPHLDIDHVSQELPLVGPEAVQRLEAEELLAMLGAIDPQFRAAIALFYLEDYSYAEIAGILGVPLGTVKSRIARGLEQLKQLVRRADDAVEGGKESQA